MNVLLVDLGGSAIKVTWSNGGHPLSRTVATPVARSSGSRHRVEFDPGEWLTALSSLESELPADLAPVDAVVVTSLRQGFVLTDGERELLPGVLNSDRRGGPYLPRLRAVSGLYALTGHWPAPELTLPKLLAVAAETSVFSNAAARLLFVADWLVWRLTGVLATERSFASAGQLLDVPRGQWATDLLSELVLPTSLLAPLVDAGEPVGRLTRPFLGAAAGTPVVAGCGDTQLAALAAGGAMPGVITVVAGSSTPVQAAVPDYPVDPLEHPWVSTHVRPGLWAAETNCGYPGTFQGWWRETAVDAVAADVVPDAVAGAVASVVPTSAIPASPGAHGLVAVSGAPVWSEHAWATKAPVTVLGLRPDTRPSDIAAAFAEAHVCAVRGNVEDLERVVGPSRVVLTGGGAVVEPGLAARLAAALGRPVTVSAGTAVDAAVALVDGSSRGDLRPSQATATRRGPAADVVEREGTATFAPEAGSREAWDAVYERYVHTWSQLREHLPEEEA